MKANERIRLMGEERIDKALFKLGIPMIISMLVTAFYNVGDTYFVSGLGTRQVVAVSVAFPIAIVFSGIGLTFGTEGAFGFQFVYSTLYLALGKAKIGGLLSMSRQGLFLIPGIFILFSILALNGIIYSQAIADLLTTIITIIFAIKIKKEIFIFKDKNNSVILQETK